MSIPVFKPETISSWIPVRLLKGDPVTIQWMYRGDIRFKEPFFDDTLMRLGTLDENIYHPRPLTNPDTFLRYASGGFFLPVKALIFHVSRCGSTLLSQLLALDPRIIALSEVPFFDMVLRSGYSFGTDETTRSSWMKSAVQLYSHRRFPEEEFVFIKTDCWHIFFYKQLRALFPDIPFILLYRRPDEVLASQQKRRGMQSVPGMVEPAVFGLSPEEMQYTDLDAYFCQVEEKILNAFAEVVEQDPLCIPLNYAQGMDSVFQHTISAAGLTITPEMQAAVNERTRFHGKYPDRPFQPETVQPELRDKMKMAFTAYEKLESLRLQN